MLKLLNILSEIKSLSPSKLELGYVGETLKGGFAMYEILNEDIKIGGAGSFIGPNIFQLYFIDREQAKSIKDLLNRKGIPCELSFTGYGVDIPKQYTKIVKDKT